mmetsp:Transcript_75581/g.225298  ORF Transcript_75581/g.225298 Transcript_75581/m.225298 type:complete len:204 (+) Transcript_75581:166-777(+)
MPGHVRGRRHPCSRVPQRRRVSMPAGGCPASSLSVEVVGSLLRHAGGHGGPVPHALLPPLVDLVVRLPLGLHAPGLLRVPAPAPVEDVLLAVVKVDCVALRPQPSQLGGRRRTRLGCGPAAAPRTLPPSGHGCPAGGAEGSTVSGAAAYCPAHDWPRRGRPQHRGRHRGRRCGGRAQDRGGDSQRGRGCGSADAQRWWWGPST